MENKNIQVIEQEKSTQLTTATPATPMQLMQIAVESNADLDKLERLMALQEKWEANNAKKSFFDAMAKFQSNCPDILSLKDGHNCKYAPLGDIVAQIRNILSDCGLSYRFEQNHANEISVTCIITHCDGHSERTTMSGFADTSGSKNAIQAIGSTVTYLKRYTLTCALGITTADADFDGRLPQDNSYTPNATEKILSISRAKGTADEKLFIWISGILKREVKSFDDMDEAQIQWLLKRMEGKK